MENRRFVNYGIFYLIGWLILAAPFFVFAYSEKTTHPALTQEIISFYNRHFPNQKLSDDEMRLVMQGSIDEDNGTRWLQHFYDPVKNRGLVLGDNELFRERGVAAIIGGMRSEWMSSKEWAKATRSQAGPASAVAGIFRPFFSSNEDYSWDRAVYEYARGDKNRGLLALGHVLHLLEDATVPDHTRNDPHPPILDMGSPYEFWAENFNPGNIKIIDSLVNERPVFLNHTDAYFDALTIFSNNNFFSKDTIFSEAYDKPRITDYIGEFGVYANGNDIYPAIRKIKKFDSSIEYTLIDNKRTILNAYWSRLSRQAVLHGSGVVKLFFDEVEKEKQTKALYDKNRSWFGKVMDGVSKRVFSIAGVLYGITTPYNLDDLDDAAQTAAIAALPLPADLAQPITAPISSEPAAEEPALSAAPQSQDDAPPEETAPSSLLQPEPAPTAAPGVSIPSENPAPQSNPTSSSMQAIAPAATSTPASSASLLQATSTSSEPEAPEVFVSSLLHRSGENPSTARDSTAPEVSTSIAECGSSLSQDGCLITTTVLTVNWSSEDGDLGHYVVECSKGGSPCSGFTYSPTSTTTTFSAEDASTYTFTAKAVDASGNESVASSRSVEVNSTPVIINEIAWAGTDGISSPHTADEWIELYNRSSKTIQLSGWILRSATDEKPYLNLSGSISAGGYYLIERTDNDTVSNISADLIAPFGSGSGMGLLDSGEVIVLQNASTTIDSTPALGSCGANLWCGGSTSGRKTMERVDPGLLGTDTTSWGTNNGLIKNGSSTDGVALNATPKARNSRNYYISQDNNILSDKTLTSSTSPYFIDLSEATGLTIASGATLTINPGVVIKFYGHSSDLVVNGTLKAIGSSANNIIFTSFYDDSYGGDLNGDGSARAPQSGDWRSMVFNSSSVNSELSYARVRYGGHWDTPAGPGHALLRAEGSSPAISNSTFEKSMQSGIWLLNSTSTISNSTIQNNVGIDLSCAIRIMGGAPAIQNNAIRNNVIGIRIESGASPAISGNSVTDNASEGILTNDSAPVFSSNSITGNQTDGVIIYGSIINDYTFPSNLPFILPGTLNLISGHTYTAPAGTIFKSKAVNATINVYGVFNISGTSENPAVFTSFKDDSYGGDTNKDGGASSPAAEDWEAMNFTSTATSSSVSYALVRYGGAAGVGAMTISSLGLDVANSTFEYNRIGLRLNNATSTISGSTFRNNSPGGRTGLYLENGSRAIISNTSFTANGVGIFSDGSSIISSGGGNTFSANTSADTNPPGLLP